MLPVDILVYVALREEFDSFIGPEGDALVGEEIGDLALTLFRREIHGRSGQIYRVAIVPAGKMGTTRAASITSALVQKLQPANLVVIGIAGTISDDLQLGDVFVPTTVSEYLANSAAVASGESWTFATSGNDFPTAARLLNRFQNFHHMQPEIFRQWQADVRRQREVLITPELVEALRKAGIDSPFAGRLQAGDDRKLASGPAVAKETSFAKWLKAKDRKYVGVEMESAGVYDTILVQAKPPRAIAIRGISDFADERKKIIEAVANTAMRVFAVKNAIALLWRAIEADLFRDETGEPTRKTSPAITPPAAVSGPGFLRWTFDRLLPSGSRAYERWMGGGSRPPDLNLGSYLADFHARMEHQLRERMYIPLEGRELPPDKTRALQPRPGMIWPIDLTLNELKGDAVGGDSANAQIAALDHQSKRVRNMLRRVRTAKRPLVILGDPGSGKTMTFEQCALLIAQREAPRVFPVIPIYVRLGDFYVDHGEIDSTHVMDHVKRSVPELMASGIERLATEGRLIVFFDGMDEMSRHRYNEHTRALSLFASRYARPRQIWAGIEGTRTLFSCRITDFSPEFIHERLVILPFTQTQISEFLIRYVGTFPLVVDDKSWMRPELAEYLAGNNTSVDANNPFSLWLLCVYLVSQKKWPTTRVEMLHYYCQATYVRKAEEMPATERARLPPYAELFFWLGGLAFEITNRNRGVSIEESSLKCPTPAAPMLDAGRLCGIIGVRDRAGKKWISFNHHRFQEYFTAYYIHQVCPSIEWTSKFDAPRWQETIFNLALMDDRSGAVAVFGTELLKLADACGAEYPALRLAKGSGRVFSRPPPLRFNAETELILSDRIEFASRLLKHEGGQPGRLHAALGPAFRQAVKVLSYKGNAITEVKMLRSCLNSPKIAEQLGPYLLPALHSKVKWVRDQALVLLSGSSVKSLRVAKPEFPSEIGFDLANGLFMERFRVFKQFAEEAKKRETWAVFYAGLAAFTGHFSTLLLLAAFGFLAAGSWIGRGIQQVCQAMNEAARGSDLSGARHLMQCGPEIYGETLTSFARGDAIAFSWHRVMELLGSAAGGLAILGSLPSIALGGALTTAGMLAGTSRDSRRAGDWLLFGMLVSIPVALLTHTAFAFENGLVPTFFLAVLLSAVAWLTGLVSLTATLVHSFYLRAYLRVTKRGREMYPHDEVFLDVAARSYALGEPQQAGRIVARRLAALGIALISILCWRWLFVALGTGIGWLSQLSHLPFQPVLNATITILGGGLAAYLFSERRQLLVWLKKKWGEFRRISWTRATLKRFARSFLSWVGAAMIGLAVVATFYFVPMRWLLLTAAGLLAGAGVWWLFRNRAAIFHGVRKLFSVLREIRLPRLDPLRWGKLAMLWTWRAAVIVVMVVASIPVAPFIFVAEYVHGNWRRLRKTLGYGAAALLVGFLLRHSLGVILFEITELVGAFFFWLFSNWIPLAKVVAGPFLVIILLGSLAMFFRGHLVAIFAQFRTAVTPPDYSPEKIDDWLRMFESHDATAQDSIILSISAARFKIKSEEFLVVLRRLERHIKGEPALSSYWAKRDQLEHALRQERRG